jgi:hypothetical protein
LVGILHEPNASGQAPNESEAGPSTPCAKRHIRMANFLHRELLHHHVLVVSFNGGKMRIVHDLVNHAKPVWPSVNQITKENHPIALGQVQTFAELNHGLEKSVHITHDPYIVTPVEGGLQFHFQFKISHGFTTNIIKGLRLYLTDQRVNA